LLVTSANWSVSAWGAGKTPPRNFELGVVFASTWSDLKDIAEPFDPPRTIPFLDRAKDNETPSSLAWAEATWDGQCIAARAQHRFRHADQGDPRFQRSRRQSFHAQRWRGQDALERCRAPPLAVRFVQGAEALEAYILDIRPPSEFAKTPLPEIDPALSGALRRRSSSSAMAGRPWMSTPFPVAEARGSRARRHPPAITRCRPGQTLGVRSMSSTSGAPPSTQQNRTDAAGSCPPGWPRTQGALRPAEGPAACLVAQELGWHIEENA
jgi:hypothetical protein